jgi:hypothetical protein
MNLASILLAIHLTVIAAPVDDVSFEVSSKTIPNDVTVKIGDKGEPTKAGKSTSPPALETLISLKDADLFLGAQNVEAVAHLALHNTKRLKSFALSTVDHSNPPPIDSAKRVSIAVVSIEEKELSDGSKIRRIEVAVDVSFIHDKKNVRARLDSNEIWETDGKVIRLTNAPKSWSYIRL